MKKVLFLCTGNYYRSRYAELYFNAHVSPDSGWRAESRGFKISAGNEGPISRNVLARARQQGLPIGDPARAPRQFEAGELADGDRVIVMDENEHRSYVEQHLPTRRAHVTYWHIPDVGGMPVDRACRAMEEHVMALLKELRATAHKHGQDGDAGGGGRAGGGHA